MSLGHQLFEQQSGAAHARAAREIVASLKPIQRSTYSIAAAIAAVAAGDPKSAPLEWAVSTTMEEESGQTARTANSLLIPTALLARDMTVAASNAGGFLVSGAEVAMAFDVLRAKSVAFRLGAQMFPGLVGQTALSKVNAGSTAYWLSTEAAQTTESQPVIGQVALTPRTAGAYVEVSRQLLKQSRLADQVIQRDLGAALSAAADGAVIAGTGVGGQPTGIVNTSGVVPVSGASLTWGSTLDAVVTSGNANTELSGWAATPAVGKVLATRERASGSGFIADGGMVAGKPLLASTGVPSATLIGGPWDDVVVGEWGVLEISADPYTQFKSAVVGIRAFWSIDVGILRPGAFTVFSSVS